MRDANYAILGANVRYSDGRNVPWIRDDTIVVKGKTRVGIIGISTPETATSTLPANVKGLKFLDPAPVIDERARQLRARGADVIVVVTPHRDIDWATVYERAPLVVDTVDSSAGRSTRERQVLRLGAGWSTRA